MSYTDYIWDLGGTLLDNYQTSAKAFQHVLMHEFGITASFDDIYNALRISTEVAIDQFASELPHFKDLYKKREVQDLKHPVLFAGAGEVLAAIVKSGNRNFMISHRDDHVIDILEAAGISRYFTEVVTANNGFARKPSPDSINYLINKYQLKQAVMIGDREIDILAGKQANIDTIYFHSADQLDVNATHNINRLSDILTL